MILKKEFYFIRHGQTDYNLKEREKEDHPPDTPLNSTGRNQAHAAKPIISSLPIKTICVSPMRRAQETKEIITTNIEADHYDLVNLGECNAAIWQDMTRYGMHTPLPSDGLAKEFIDRVRKGINEALEFPGPVLIVAHGGIHWATCCLMGMRNHSWLLDNCGVVHFSLNEDGHWRASLVQTRLESPLYKEVIY